MNRFEEFDMPALLQEDRRFLVTPFLLSILLPWIHIFFIRDLPSFATPIIDSSEYYATALEMMNTKFEPHLPYYHSPLYPLFLAGTFLLFSQNLLIPRIIQAVLNGFSCLLIYILGRRFFSRSTARVASLLWALYGPILFFSGELLNVTLSLFLNILALVLVIGMGKRMTAVRGLLAGVVLGLAAITRADILPFAGVVAIGLLLLSNGKRDKKGQIIPVLLIFLVGVSLPLIGVGVRNYRVTGDFTVMPLNSGINFYIGNNPHYRETTCIRPGFFWQELKELPLREGNISYTDLSGARDFFYQESFRYILDDPKDYVGNLFFKVRTLVNGYELPETFDLYSYRRYSPILSLLVWKVGDFAFPYGLLLPLAVLGLLLCRNRMKDLWWLWAMAATLFVSLIGYWNSSRYRISLVPILLLFASVALVRLWSTIRQKRSKEAVGMVVSVPILVLIMSWPLAHFTQAYHFTAEMLTLAAHQMRGVDTVDYRIRLLNESLKLQGEKSAGRVDPGFLFGERLEWDYIEAANQYNGVLKMHTLTSLGKALVDGGRVEEGVKVLKQAQEIVPGAASVLYYLGIAYTRWGKRNEAMEYYSKALEIKPAYEKAHTELANLLANAGRFEEALEHYRAALKDANWGGPFHNAMGLTLAALGRLDEAVFHFRKAIDLTDRYPEARYNLGNVLARLERYEEASQSYKEALKLRPDFAEAHNNLGMVLSKQGRFDEAVEHFRKALTIQPDYAVAEKNLNILLGRVAPPVPTPPP